MNAVHLAARLHEQQKAIPRRLPPGSRQNPTARMILRRSVAVAFACIAGLALGSCASFSDSVADHWPHFAGGEPDDLPPRPGAPGYNQFIAHGQPAQGTPSPAAGTQPADAGATAAIKRTPDAAQVPNAFTEPPPAADAKPAAPRAPADDPSAVQGGLY
jgi:hypothetical protein